MRRPPRNQRGFTLVELLVATMLLTIVMTAVYTLFFTVIQSWRSIENDEGTHRKARNTLSLIQREYDNVFAPAAHLMEGTHDEVTLFVNAPPMESGESRAPRLMRVRYTFNPSDGTLAREEALVQSPIPPAAPDSGGFQDGAIEFSDTSRQTIARGLADVAFHYVWMPHPDGPYWRAAPVFVEPMIARYHAMEWGLPQALDVELTYLDEEKSTPFVVHARFPTRTASQRREAYQLVNMLGDAL